MRRTTPSAQSLAPIFAALADPTRLRLLHLMAGREVCVCYFAEALGESQPKISRHLAYLRRMGIAAARREGKWAHYQIKFPAHAGAAAILRQTLVTLQKDPAMRMDLKRLRESHCVK